MQLDRTAIVIALRTSQELLDLSLVVIREFAGRFILFALIGIIPFAILNAILLEPLRNYDQLSLLSSSTTSNQWFRFQYLWWMALLVILEAPLALLGLTLALGNTVFLSDYSRKNWLNPIWNQSGAILWILGFLRGAIPALLVTAYMALNQELHRSFTMIGWLSIAALLMLLFRGINPFAPEILALEQTKLNADPQRPNAMTYSKRTQWLRKAQGDAAGIGVTAILISVAATLMLCLCAAFLLGVLIGTWKWGWWMDLIIYPIALWITAVWSTVLRFLTYMNTRIRAEGWDLELKLRAEAQRLSQIQGAPNRG